MNDKKGEKNEKSIIINKNNFNERELYQEKITKLSRNNPYGQNNKN